MRIIIYYDNKILLDYLNTSIHHNKIPYSFEKLSTLIECPSCNNNSIIERFGYFPCVDSFCHYTNCHHTIEVKSILAEGNQKNAYQSIPFDVKLGSPKTYSNITKQNKSLMIFWYNIDETNEYQTTLSIRNCIIYNMEKFEIGYNCLKENVLQGKKIRLNLKIFPEFSIYKELFTSDFKFKNSNTRIQEIKAKNDYNIISLLKSKKISKRNLLNYSTKIL